ncbi:MAG: anthranilate synthase component I family protein [Bacteroidales bacterium]
MKIKLKQHKKKNFADQITPISIYYNVRDQFAGSLLLESSEIDDEHNSRSIICANPVGGISLVNNELRIYYGNKQVIRQADEISNIADEINDFIDNISIDTKEGDVNGLFGFQSFEAVKYFESKKANLCPRQNQEVAVIDYRLYQYVICINHFNNEITFIENSEESSKQTLDKFINIALHGKSSSYPFSLVDEEVSSCTDKQFIKNVKMAIQHCKLGNIFQMVLSRRYCRRFKGDEFNVYRALRHINPSPYMFFFDYTSYKIFGSSPEAQLLVAGGEAIVNPIAGTYKRTGDKVKDMQLQTALLNDYKELAEHSMLIDLARNDLSRNCEEVQVSDYKSIHQYSHVIHLVSTVRGKLKSKEQAVKVLADTFPAGTLSGAPKVKAIQLLADIEEQPRDYYGGSIGYISFSKEINQAITIRSFMTKGNVINYQAGAGIVLNSKPDSELQEVHNKLGALRSALELAEKIYQ